MSIKKALRKICAKLFQLGKVVQTHSVTDFSQRLVGYFIGIGTALLEHVVDGRNVLGKLSAALANWLELVV